VRTVFSAALYLATKSVPAILLVQQSKIINQAAVSTAVPTIPKNILIIISFI
jgi:hypothetical protein